MTALAALLGRLAAEGLSVQIRGEALAVSPPERLTPELRTLLLQFKPEVMELLRIHGGDLLPLFRQSESECGSVSWRLSAEGPGWAAVRSSLLDGVVVFIDETVTLPPRAASLVSYTQAEMETLATATADALRELHGPKKISGGRVTSLNTVEDLTAGRLSA